MFQKMVISLVIFTVLIAGCTSGPAPVKGTLQFSSSPSGAQVYLDNQLTGITPSTLTGVEPGNHALEYRYTGYQNWRTSINVSPGPSSYFAGLTPLNGQVVPTVGTPQPGQSAVTVKVERDLMIIGNSQMFSGTGTPGENVLLVLFGPGRYVDGIEIIQANVKRDGHWTYLWNPGYSLQSGSYTLVVSDAAKTMTARAGFNIVGGGLVSVTTGRFNYAIGDPVAISGMCTTGDRSVVLTLYGPQQFTNGVDLGTQTVNADNSWSYRYMTSYGMPVGMYTLSVRDAQGTTSGTASFLIST